MRSSKKAFSLSVLGLAAKSAAGKPLPGAESKIDFAAQLRTFGIAKDGITLQHASLKGKEHGNLTFNPDFSISCSSRVRVVLAADQKAINAAILENQQTIICSIFGASKLFLSCFQSKFVFLEN